MASNWNYTKYNGFEYGYKEIVDILKRNNNKLDLNELIYLLNDTTEDQITFKGKKKPFTKFIKYHKGEFLNYLDMYDDIKYIKQLNNIVVMYTNIDSEWTIITEEDY
tara:strand:+ start:543 stop:863 length:321 start_codon:yes stop_codon:yes gene_type:complete